MQYTYRKFSQFRFLHIDRTDFQNFCQASVIITDMPNFKMLFYIDLIPSHQYQNSEI